MRVTMNQALIVALGSMVDGTDMTTPPGTPGLDTAHATPGRLLHLPPAARPDAVDPRGELLVELPRPDRPDVDVAARALRLPGRHRARDELATSATRSRPTRTSARPGCRSSATTPTRRPATRPTRCSADRERLPELELLVERAGQGAALLAAHHQRVRDRDRRAERRGRRRLAARPPVRGAQRPPRLHRRVRPDSAMTRRHRRNADDPEIAAGLPSDGYGRGAAAPVLPNQPTLFFRAGTENICEAVAAQTIDVPMAKQIAGVQQLTKFVSPVSRVTTSVKRTHARRCRLAAHRAREDANRRRRSLYH